MNRAPRRNRPRDEAANDEAPPRGRPILPLFMLFAGALAGRIAAEILAPGPLGMFDLVVYAGLALAVALGYRRFARRAMASRHRDRAWRARISRRDGSESETRTPPSSDGDRQP